ncbi:MAG: transglutaminase domain-containing protein, partial [Bacteroidota bacterium]
MKPARKRKDLRKKSFRTNDIIQLVQEVIKTDVDDTEVLAQQFSPTKEGLRALFELVDRSFRYEEDPPGSQWVQTPSYLWNTRVGDCKSYTVFISSVLQNIGLPHLIRYAAYGTRQYRHVYPVALLDGEKIPLDVVWKKQEGGPFGQEKPYTKKKDFRVEGLYKLGNSRGFTEEAIIGQLKSDLEQIQAVSDSIPNTIEAGMGDVTQMSAGELDRLIMADRYRTLAGITDHGGKKGQYLDAARAMEQGDIAGIGS